MKNLNYSDPFLEDIDLAQTIPIPPIKGIQRIPKPPRKQPPRKKLYPNLLFKNKIRHFFNEKAAKITWDDIKNQFKNIPYCYLTGRKLDWNDPKTISLDHYIPKFKGGKNELENLRLCCPQANLAKHTLSHEEFVSLANEVVTHHNAIDILNCP